MSAFKLQSKPFTIILLVISLFLPLVATTNAQDRQQPNGISVGRPKVFDNRTLTLMLESLSETLRNMQSQFIDQKALAAAFSFLQGSRSSEVSRSFSVKSARFMFILPAWPQRGAMILQWPCQAMTATAAAFDSR